MTRIRWVVSCVAVVASIAILAAQQNPPQAQEPTFRANNRTVAVYATVTGTDGQLVRDLTKDDFEVLDNGRPQPITLFDNGLQPISIIIMLDMSGSMLGNLPVVRNAAVQMFTRLLPNDKARVGSFGDRITVTPTFTNNVDELIRALWLDLEPGGNTPLWGAVNVAMTDLAHVDGRRVVLVLSDGKDTSGMSMGRRGGVSSMPTLADVVQRAQTEDFMIYAIGLRSRGAGGGSGGGFGGGRGGGRGGFGGGSDEPDPGLKALAVDSGGGYFELTNYDNMGPSFARIADELHRQYQLGFTLPAADGKLHTVEVRTKTTGLTVRARKSYIASAGK